MPSSQEATVAQLAEHTLRKREVMGSSPIGGSSQIARSESSLLRVLLFRSTIWPMITAAQ
jgi:hypothetical protein